MSSRVLDSEEVVRRVLPWYLMPRFSNVLLGMREIEAYKAYKVNLSVNEVSTVFVPGASRFLVVPRVEYEVADEEAEKRVRVKVTNGFIHGFLPNGKYAKYLAKTVIGDEEIYVKYRDSYTDFAIDNVVRNYLRVKTGPLFAFKVEQFCKKKGVSFSKIEPEHIVDDGRLKASVSEAKVIIREKSVYTTIKLPIFLYNVSYKTTHLKAPGIVPGILQLLRENVFDPLDDNPDAKQSLQDFLKEITEVGSSIMSISSATLQRTSKSKFTYIIGEVDGPDSILKRYEEELKKTGRELMWITGAPAYRGVRVSFYLSPKNRKIYMRISILPFNAPATVVLNYPPFNIAPLSALMNQRIRFLRFNLDKVDEYLIRRGLRAGFFDADYEVLGEAGITFDEIRQVLRDGYPRIEHLRPILEKSEKLGYIGDIMAHAYGKETKIEKILIKELKPLLKMTQKEKRMSETVAEAEKTVSVEEEEEEVML